MLLRTPLSAGRLDLQGRGYRGPGLHFERFGEVRRIRQIANPTNSKSRTTTPPITNACTSGPADSTSPLGILSRTVGMSKKLPLPSEAPGLHAVVYLPAESPKYSRLSEEPGSCLQIAGLQPSTDPLGSARGG